MEIPTIDRMLNSPTVIATFRKDGDDNVSYLLNVLEALFSPIEIGDKFLDGYRDWEERTCTEYFRRDFHSTAFLRVPIKGKSNEKESQCERPSNEQENRQGSECAAGHQPVRVGSQELLETKPAEEAVSDVSRQFGRSDGVGEDRENQANES